MKDTSLGLVETKGLIGAITAADAMAKAAAVELTRRHRPGGARVVIMCRGELAACDAAVAAGAEAAGRVGELLCATVLARPEEGANTLCEELLDEAVARRAAKKAQLNPSAGGAGKKTAQPARKVPAPKMAVGVKPAKKGGEPKRVAGAQAIAPTPAKGPKGEKPKVASPALDKAVKPEAPKTPAPAPAEVPKAEAPKTSKTEGKE